MTRALPSLFVSHGAPDLVLGRHPARSFLRNVSGQFPRPRGIVVVSAHWQTSIPMLTSNAAPETIHDFLGWQGELYELTYPAQTSVLLIDQVIAALGEGGFSARTQPARGFDHGAWVPLKLAYPDADIPVVQLSLTRGTASEHFVIGEALAPLAEAGILVVGSGSSVHNLSRLAPEGTPPAYWATSFEHWLHQAVEERDLDQLLAFPRHPHQAFQAHPTPEHLLPLFVAMGAGWSRGQSKRIHHSFSYGSLGMSSYLFGTAA